MLFFWIQTWQAAQNPDPAPRRAVFRANSLKLLTGVQFPSEGTDRGIINAAQGMRRGIWAYVQVCNCGCLRPYGFLSVKYHLSHGLYSPWPEIMPQDLAGDLSCVRSPRLRIPTADRIGWCGLLSGSMTPGPSAIQSPCGASDGALGEPMWCLRWCPRWCPRWLHVVPQIVP